MIPPIASQFVAGETQAEALAYVRRVNDHEINAIVNRLGTHHEEWDRIAEVKAEYEELVAAIGGTNLDACVSVKPSQIGLDLGEPVFRDHLASLVETASRHDVFIWLDMEEHETTDATIEAFETLAPEYEERLGICLQANLYRTIGDLDRLETVPGAVRLVKGGSYDEPETVACMDRERMNRRYREILRYAFEHYEGDIAVATHDIDAISFARSVGDSVGREFEIQMLMGVRTDAIVELSEEYDVAQYVPYGRNWKKWTFNRLTENPRTFWFVIQAVLGNSISRLGRTSDDPVLRKP